MTSLLAIGIEEYNTFADIPCAYSDAFSVYNTLNNVLKNTFLSSTSICLKNIDDNQFLEMLSMYQLLVESDDKLIVYFSGHGEIIKDEFYFCFSNDNKRDPKKGKIPLKILNDKLENINCHIILILDSCHSGAALNLSIKNNIYLKSKISTLTSSEAYNGSQFDDVGSFFTKAFCDSLQYLHNQEEDITLNNIYKAMKLHNYSFAKINVQEGEVDIELEEKIKYSYSNTFLDDIITKYLKYSIALREMLWYQTEDIPLSAKHKLLNKYKVIKLSEPSWLVRRAIGTFIYKLKEDNKKIEYLKYFLYSSNWMDNCIGLIGARYSLQNYEIQNLYKGFLTEQTFMDSCWLANLYLTDSNIIDVKLLMKSNFIKSSWGVLDLWQRLEKHYENKMDLLFIVKENIDSHLLVGLLNHIALENKYYDILKINIDKTLLNEDLLKSKFVHMLYVSKSRGSIKNIKSKWLYSGIYGNWRNHTNLDYSHYIDNTNLETIQNELNFMKSLPLVEMRMSLFQFFLENKQDYEELLPYLTWGLNDSHPWVVREAVKLFDLELIQDKIDTNIDRLVYPGFFDLVIELSKKGFNISTFLNKYKLTKQEKSVLEHFLKLEI